jgi:hypothetical protein
MAEPKLAKPKADEGARPRVVIIVRELAGAAATAATAPKADGVAAKPATGKLPPKTVPGSVTEKNPRPPIDDETSPAEVGEVVGTAVEAIDGGAQIRIEVPRSRFVEDRPTERIKKESRTREPEDDVLVAAVIPIVLGQVPSPLDDFLGRSLLFRAARAALRAGAPRLILLGELPDDVRRRVHDEAYAGFGGKPVELRSGDPVVKDFGRGRVLILDGCALHDPESVRRLGQSKGQSAALLLSDRGDGLRVRTEGGRVRQVGLDVASADGVMSGAASIPVEHFERVTRLGERAALEELVGAELLVGVAAPRNYGQQFRAKEDFEAARRDAFDSLASSGPSGSFDDLFGRPLSRRVTLGMLHRPVFTPARVSIIAGVLALVGAFALAASGVISHHGDLHFQWISRLVAVLAGLLLVGSAILDRSDGELARLRLDTDEDARFLDFGLDHFAHAIAFMALAFQVQTTGALDQAVAKIPRLSSLLAQYHVGAPQLGLIACGGVIVLAAMLLWRGPPQPDARGLRSWGDGMANAFNSRDYFYLLTIAALLNCAPPLYSLGVMGGFLLVTTVLVQALWLLLLLFNLVAPAPEE